MKFIDWLTFGSEGELKAMRVKRRLARARVEARHIAADLETARADFHKAIDAVAAQAEELKKSSPAALTIRPPSLPDMSEYFEDPDHG